MRPFDESELPPVTPVSRDDAFSEGLMLAEYSCRMRLKNRIIVGVLTHDRPYAPGQYLDEARLIIGVLADEFELEEQRVARQLRTVGSIPGKAAHAHDYRSGDTRNLRLREDVSAAVASALRSRSSDEEYLLGLIESARQDAWHDISRAVEDWLDRASIQIDAEYEAQRDERMRLLADDLLALQAVSTNAAEQP